MSDYKQALERLAAMLRMHSQLASHPQTERTEEKLFRRVCEQYAVNVQQQIDLVDAVERSGRHACI